MWKRKHSYVREVCRSCTKRSCDIIFMKMKVIWFCLQKTISGSYLKQNNSDLVFQIRTIFLKIMSMFVAGHVTRMWYLKHYGLCGSKNYPYLPYRRDFSLDPPPLWKFQSSFIHLLTFLGLWEPPNPQEFPIHSVGGVWTFSGTTHYLFLNRIFYLNFREIVEKIMW